MIEAKSQPLSAYLDHREEELKKLVEELYQQLIPFEAELVDVRRAKAAITGRQEPGPHSEGAHASHVLFASKRRFFLRNWREAQEMLTPAEGREVKKKIEAPAARYAHLTLKQLVVKALSEQFPHGATANQMIEFFQSAWERDVQRPSLSPQLSRLKEEKVITLRGKVWSLPARETKAPSENGSEGALSTTVEGEGTEKTVPDDENSPQFPDRDPG